MKHESITGDLLALRVSSEAAMVARLARCLGLASADGAEEKCSDGSVRCANQGGARVIQIRGILARGVAGWFPWATDFDELEAQILAADDDDNVSAIVLDIDSPGGTVNGTPEAADVIASVSKPVVAYTAGGMYSAAYYLAAPADMIAVRRSSGVGSIGVIRAHFDYSGLYEKEGIRVEVFRSGENKFPGAEGTSLTEGQREMLQGMIDRMGNEFREHVLRYRPEVDLEWLDGREFTGNEAVESGFADGIAGNIGDAVKAALGLAGM